MQGPLIVVVDDDPRVGGEIENALAQAGYAVETFSDAERGLSRLLAAPRPAVAILDHMMPKKTGVVIAGALRAEGIEIPIVLLTGITLRHVEREHLDSLGVRTTSKPVKTDVLVALVERIAPRDAPA